MEASKEFFDASENLPIESKPLTSYYCCMNAAKALLAIRGDVAINFDNLSHGITSDRRQWKTNHIKDAEVIFDGSGVLYELSKYLGEEAGKKYIQYMICSIIFPVFIVHFQLHTIVRSFLFQ